MVSRHTDEHLDLCAAYALGTLDEVSRRHIELHVREGCPECEAALRDFGVATTALAATAPEAMPSSQLRERVLASAARDVRRPRRVPMAVAASLAAAAVIFFVATVSLWMQVRGLNSELLAMRARLDSVEQEFMQASATVAFLTGAGTDCFDFAPTGQGESALVGRGCFSASSGEVVVTLDQVVAPAGKDFELWVLRGGTPTSLGLVRPDNSGHAVVSIPALSNAGAITAFAVSLEAAGGSTGAGPAGPVLSVGALGT